MAHASFYKGSAIIHVYNSIRITNAGSRPPEIITKSGTYDVRRIHPLELLPKHKDSNMYLRRLVLDWYTTLSSLPIITDRAIYIYHIDKYEFGYLVGQSTRDKVERYIRDYIERHSPNLLIPVR